MTIELGASIQQLEVTRKELATERQNYFHLNRALENAVARLQRREQARWRRALSLLLTVVLGAATGAATFAVFLWLYVSPRRSGAEPQSLVETVLLAVDSAESTSRDP